MPDPFTLAVVCRRCGTPRRCTQRPDFCGCGAVFARDSYALVEGSLVTRGRSLRTEIQVRFVGAWTDAERRALIAEIDEPQPEIRLVDGGE